MYAKQWGCDLTYYMGLSKIKYIYITSCTEGYQFCLWETDLMLRSVSNKYYKTVVSHNSE